MAEINIKITASLQDFSTFADELGYQTLVPKTEDELALLPEPIAIEDRLKPNPQGKQEFLEDYFAKVTINELFRRKATAIDIQVNDAKNAEKESIKQAITSAVSVTSRV